MDAVVLLDRGIAKWGTETSLPCVSFSGNSIKLQNLNGLAFFLE